MGDVLADQWRQEKYFILPAIVISLAGKMICYKAPRRCCARLAIE